MFGSNAGGVGLAGVDVTITTWISNKRKHTIKPNKLAKFTIK
jgi:hypothetical protein